MTRRLVLLGLNVANTVHLGLQAIALPASLLTATLDRITFVSAGGFPQGQPFLAAATVSAIPESVALPGAALVIGLGAAVTLPGKRR